MANSDLMNPDGTYKKPTDEYGNELGPPPNTTFNPATGLYDAPRTQDSTDGGTAGGPAPGPSNGGGTLTPAPYTAPNGVPQAWAEDFLRKNPGDYGRVEAGYQSELRGQAADRPGSAGPAPGPSSLQSAYSGYLGGQQAPPQVDLSPVTNAITQMQQQAAEDRARQQAQQEAMRQLVLSRITEASKPVDVNAPGIREILAAQRLSGQRSEERQRSQLAAKLASEGLSSSGAMDTGLSQIAQQRGETEQQGIAAVLGNELQSKRDELDKLLSLAVSSGDAESARTLQSQISMIDAQLQSKNLESTNQRASNALDFSKSSFLDDLGYRLLALQLGANANAASAFL